MSRALQSMIGQKFNQLTVIDQFIKNDKTYCICSCDCERNKETEVSAQNLKNNAVMSCGCGYRKRPYGEAARHGLFHIYETGAIKRNLEFLLTEKEFEYITKQNCYYCGIEPKQSYGFGRSNGDYVYNGIDRYDNNYGYCLENCVPACKICNYAKDTLTTQEFLEWVKRIAIHNPENFLNSKEN
jgi:hypothetical protein